MAERLIVRYPLGTAVEILLAQQVWRPGVVVRHQHPAVWVRTTEGREWFVTNQQHIRLRGDVEHDT